MVVREMSCLLAVAVSLLADPEVLEPSVQNEVDHALASVPKEPGPALGDEAVAFAAFHATNGLSASQRAISLVSSQKDGRWRWKGADVTPVAVWLLQNAAGRSQSPAWECSLREGWEFRREGGAWETVSVPHDWAIAGPFDKTIDMQVVAIAENGEEKAAEKTGRTGSLPWIGKGEYRRTVEIPAGTSFASLVFDGAMSEPAVFCDGVKVGEWKNGYNAFEVELPAKAGRHEVLVKLTNRPESSRWYPGAGLFRPVRLVLGGETGVRTWGNAIWTPDLGTVRVTTECRGKPGRIVYRILDGARELAVSETGTLKGAFEPWSPESPKLYTLVTEVYDAKGALADRRTDRFGVRTLEYGRRGFLLNGKARKFKGVCMHHDLGPLGIAFDKDAFRRQMTLLKEMGCDALRTSHNMPGEGQLEVCDELGILVMAESFDSWDLAKVKNGYNLFFKDWWRKDLVNLVKKCRNHPSVVMWSIGNEIFEQHDPKYVAVIREMQALCHRFDPDPGRKVTQGLSWMPQAIESGWNAAMEIPAVTYRLPFYEAMYTNSAAGFVLGAETASTVSSRGEYFFPVEPANGKCHANLQCSSYDVEWTPWSNLPDDDWAMQEDRPWTIGEFVWTGFDYLGEPYPYDRAWPSRSSYFGIFDLAGLPKDRYWLYRSHWNTDSHTLHLVPHWTFPDRVGKVTPVYCYTDFDEAELFVNGQSQGRRRKDRTSRLDRFRLRWNDVVYAPGELKVVAYGKDGKPAMTETVRTAGAPAKVELAKRRFGNLLFVTATVVDAQGTPVPDACPELAFSCGANLRFRGVCNGDATSVESFVVPHMKAYHGQLVAIFEGEGESVGVRLRAAGDPLPPLAGDGVTDDTAAIQARLDAGTSCVYLPPPKDHYVISKTLKIGSDQELRLDRFTRIRLAPKSDCPLLENRCYVADTGTNANVAVTGGIWDMDNLRQQPNRMQVKELRAKMPKTHVPEFFWGMAMRFCHVEGITVKDVTIRNPTTYGIEFGHVSNFLVSDIVFDYKTWNPIPLNMDGVHFDGFCHHGKVMNLRGTCFDDLVALNANDGACSPEEGPITDVDIDGLYADYCHSAARILSAGADIRRITIRNVHGRFYCYTVGLTHYFPQKPRGRFDDIVIEDVFASKALVPPECGGQSYRGPMEIVHLQGPIDVGNLVVSRLYRDESCLPTATIGVDARATVENLAVRDCRMTNRLAEPIDFILNRGKVQKLVSENNTFVGAWRSNSR